MTWNGEWAGGWSGVWFGEGEPPAPGSISGSTSIAIACAGTLTATSQQADDFIGGAVSIARRRLAEPAAEIDAEIEDVGVLLSAGLM